MINRNLNKFVQNKKWEVIFLISFFLIGSFLFFSSPTDISAAQCLTTHTCDNQSGICAGANSSTGCNCFFGGVSSCDTGSIVSCQGFTCSGAQVCNLSACVTPGTCGAATNTCDYGTTFSDTADGACTNNWSCLGLNGGANTTCSTNKANGTSCNDSNACTNPDTCSSGSCSGTNNPVNATLGAWSLCNGACGGGSGTQTRTCSGASCGGDATCGGASLSQSCVNNTACIGSCDDSNACTTDSGSPPNCTHTNNPVQGSLSAFGACSGACGGGIGVKTQTCNGASCGGNCNGASLSTGCTNNTACGPGGDCNDSNACTTDTGTPPNCTHTNNPVNASWSCSGNTAVCAGASCSGSTTCSGSAPTCGVCTPVNGTWSGCGATASCSATCGGTCSGSAPTCSCTSDGSCSATPACGTTTTGVDNCGNSCSRTGGSCASSPDLTAEPVSVSPTTVVAGTPLTFTAAIDNVGTSGTGFGFPVLFQVKDGGGTLLPDLVPVMASPISAGGYRFVTSPSSPAYTFSSSGSYTVRACADKSNRNDVYGYITESNEYNNCGAWTPVTVASSITGEPGELRGKILKDDNGNGLQDAGEVFIRDPANPGCIKPSYAQAITISYGGGNTTTLNQCSSNTNDPIYSVNLDPGAYTVSASLPAGWEFIGPSTSVANISSNVMTLVQFIMRPIAVTTTANINANPSNNIPYNTSSLLNWSYANATSCTITPPGTISGYPSGSGSVSTGNLTVSRTYTISCNPGPVTDNVQVTVQAQPKNLVVVKAGQGTVTGTSNPPQTNIDCGPTCQANYDSGTVIKLTETPNSGRIFTGWSGVVCSGASESQKTSTCTFTIGNDLTIVASFAIDPNYREF